MATELLRVNGAGATTNWTKGGAPPAATNWESVDESVANDDVDYVEMGGPSGGVVDVYALPDPVNVSGTINSVTVWFRARATSSGGNMKGVVRVGTTNYVHTNTLTIGTTWTDWSQVWTTRPSDSQPWTLADIQALQAGVFYGGSAFSIRVTQVWVVVDYTPAAGSPTWYFDLLKRY